MKIEELGLSPRTVNALGRAGIWEVEQLRDLTEKDLLKLRGIGVGCIKELKSAVQIASPQEITQRKHNDLYNIGFRDGANAAILAAVNKLMGLAEASKGAQSAALKVAAQTIGKMEVP